jgi:L-ascorbate metabolism protein UlaG (beta-lactamase superfamily)
MKRWIKIVLLLTIVVTFWAFIRGDMHTENDIQRFMKSERYKDSKFVNSIETNSGSFKDIFKIIKDYRSSSDVEKVPLKDIQVNRPIFDESEPKSDSYKIVWFGHSGFILEMSGVRLLVDAVFSERASMLSFVGPKRFHEPPLLLEELPHIDAVVLSHDHYDHLDRKVVNYFADKDVKFIMPLGVGSHLKKWGVSADKITELDYHDSINIGDLELIAGPARHFSGRGLLDRNKTLWCSFMFFGTNQQIFYSGDTGYTETYKMLKDRYGSFDVCLIQIGAYNKNWEDIHLYPSDAVKMSEMLGSEYTIPLHWGTFNLAMHSWTEPVEEFVKHGNKAGIKISTPEIGAVTDSSNINNTDYWWRL